MLRQLKEDSGAEIFKYWQKRESELLGAGVCRFLSVFFKLKKTHTEYKDTQRTEDSRKVLDLNAENELTLVQSPQFASSYHNIHFLIRNEIKLRIPQAPAHTM